MISVLYSFFAGPDLSLAAVARSETERCKTRPLFPASLESRRGLASLRQRPLASARVPLVLADLVFAALLDGGLDLVGVHQALVLLVGGLILELAQIAPDLAEDEIIVVREEEVPACLTRPPFGILPRLGYNFERERESGCGDESRET